MKMENTQNEKKGKVWLAGAGPGDGELLTLKTSRLMEQADVIVYDALISAEILSRIPDTKEVIYVGKHAGNHPVPQEEINQILVREAKKGKHVLRLKGGDPFVFGRGGEELEDHDEDHVEQVHDAGIWPLDQTGVGAGVAVILVAASGAAWWFARTRESRAA